MRTVLRRKGNRQPEQESGQILLLLAGYAVLCLLVASVVVGVSAVHIERQRLLSVADGAAQAAADSFTFGDVLGGAGPPGTGPPGTGPPGAVLRAERVRGAAAAFLNESQADQRFEGLTINSATGSPDGRSAQVTLGAVVRFPLLSMLLPEGHRIEATSTARARLSR